MKTIDDVLNEWNKVKTNGHNIGEVLKHYLVCAIWADGDEEWSDADIYEMSIESADYAGKEIINFLSLCGDLLEDWTDEQIGHDFWLTRQGQLALAFGTGHTITPMK